MIDVQSVQDFLSDVVGNDGLIEVRRSTGAQTFHDTPALAAEHIASVADDVAGGQIWFGVAPRLPGSRSGTTQDVYAPKCFFADIDNFPKWDEVAVDAMLYETGLPEPTYVVATGGGHHLYWVYEGDLERHQWTPREVGLLKKLDAYVQSHRQLEWVVDPAPKSMAQVMQVPGVPNHKYEARGETRRWAKVLDDASSLDVYPASRFDPHDGDGGPSDVLGFELPDRIVGTGPDSTPHGGQNNTLFLFCSHAFVVRGLSYNETVSEARAFFSNPETCDPPIPFDTIRDVARRTNAYNTANRQAFEQERRGRGRARGEQRRGQGDGAADQQETLIPDVARWVSTQFLRDRARSVDGFGLMVYSDDNHQYLGGVYSESAVRLGLVRMEQEHPEFQDALRRLHSGAGFTAVYKEVQARSRRVPSAEISGEVGVIPLNGESVLSITAGEVVNRRSNPPFFNWKSNAHEQDVVKAISRAEYGAWGEFLLSSFPDREERLYLQRLMYYTALGGNSERVFIIAHGPSSAGKNLFFESVTRAIHGQVQCPQRSLVIKTLKETDPTLHLRLSGYRLIFCDEINRGDHLDTSKVKALVADAGIRARAAYAKEDAVGSNTFVLALLTNYLPELDGYDEGLFNRLHFISFRVGRRHPDRSWRKDDDRPPMDPTLKSRIKDHEVLAWIAGGRDGYEKDGLSVPESFQDDARAWVRKVDAVGTWASDMLDEDPSGSGRISFGQLHKRFQSEMMSVVNLPQFKDMLRDWIDRQGWKVENARVDNSMGIKGIVYKGSEVV